MNITEENKRRSKKKKSPLLLYIIIPFLSFFIYILSNSGLSIKELPDLFFYTPPKVKYETFKLSFDKDIPEDIVSIIKSSIDDIELNGVKRFKFSESGGYKVVVSDNLEDSMYFKQYAVVGHMYWIKGSTTMEEIKKSGKVYLSSDGYDVNSVFLDQLFGDSIQLVKSEDILSALQKSESYVAIVPIENLKKEMKVLVLDNKYCIEDSKGCLYVGYRLENKKDSDFVGDIIGRNMEIEYGESKGIDKDNIVKVNMSGVVAISRGLAQKIDNSGDFAYPAKKLGSFLADADLTHVSNEVSFVDGCVGYTGMVFCSKPKYVETLKASGVDIVELTGNHNNDYGAKYNKSTIEKYIELGWDHFGGGLNSDDASKILYKEVKGNLLAFMGYNWYDTINSSRALAGSSSAGANSYSVEKLTKDIKEAKDKGAVVIVTFQFQECYSYPSSDVIYPICYKPLSSPDQKKVFRQAIDLGADIVVGTQAHQPQTYEIYGKGLIFYGLGNLYFDQDEWIGTRQGLVLSLYVQDSNIIQVKITPIIVDSSLIPHIADETDSKLLLNLLKSARNF